MKLKTIFASLGLALSIAIGGVAAFANKPESAKNVNADYSSTIRVYVDLDWGNIDYVRLGTDQASGAAVLSSSKAKYNQS